MKASTLIRRFVGLAGAPSTAFVRLYAAEYGGTLPLPEVGPPPSAGHAGAMQKSLIEWTERLDRLGVEVHQEGGLARFEGVALAPVHGRHPWAALARAKTAAFYALVLRSAVRQGRAHSFEIPATAAQGLSVALAEARASAIAFREGVGGLESLRKQAAAGNRPELEAEIARAEGSLGRAVSMHETAVAEAIGCGFAAQGGPWFQCLRTEGRGAETHLTTYLHTDVMCVGVEVWRGQPALEGGLVANLDTQHGGGIFGLGGQGSGVAACDTALSLVKDGLCLPDSARFFTPRPDPDAFVAAGILGARIPSALFQNMEVEEALKELARLDAGRPTGRGWVPSPGDPQIVSVGDHPFWGVVARALNPLEGAPDLSACLAGTLAALTGDEDLLYSALPAECDAFARDREDLASRATDVHLMDGIAVGDEMPFSPGLWGLLYSASPVGVLRTTKAPGFSGKVKYTIACHPDARGATKFHEVFRRLAGPGWGGAATITGSPFGGTDVTLAQVAKWAAQAASDVGMVLPSARAVETERKQALALR